MRLVIQLLDACLARTLADPRRLRRSLVAARTGAEDQLQRHGEDAVGCRI